MKKNHINDIGLDVGKSLQDNMIQVVNDMNSCIAISDRLNARMDAFNRHLNSETGVECARVVEREKGSGFGG